MNEEKRTDPEALLEDLKRDERGKLTVFLGAAAGVGKTYAMLESARERLAEGVDLVAGWVETHGRKETEALLDGLPLIPPTSVEYRGKIFSEMDLNAILERHPQLVLVDELAHTNIPGLRNEKRYQDVEELLSAGIDVYTTINIQHFESLNDVVAKITGVTVRETVPDRVLEEAELQLIDIPPEELIQRLREGKVYVPAAAAEALEKFFRPGNINALREMSLRYAARRVDHQLEKYMQSHAISGPWPVSERVLVCISSSPFAARLIRNGSRLAASLQAEWLVAYVEIPDLPLKESDKLLLQRNLHLAEQLGAETVVLSGDDPAQELLQLTAKRNITQIVIGKPLRFKLSDWIYGSVVEKVIRQSEGISVHVIPGRFTPERIPGKKLIKELPSSLKSLLRPMFALLVITGLVYLFGGFLGLVNIGMLYLLPILIAAAAAGPVLSVVAAVISFLTFDILFVPPVLNITIYDLRYLWTLAIYLLVAWLTGNLSARLHLQVDKIRQRERMMTALYDLSREIVSAGSLQEILESVAKKVGKSIEGEVVILLPNEAGRLKVRSRSAPDGFKMGKKEMAVAIWVFQHGRIAGRGTDILGGAGGTYAPIMAGETPLGVLGIRPKNRMRYLTGEERQLFEAFARLIAAAVNRSFLSDQARRARFLEESERLHTALFNSVSHELRTPLTSITGAVTCLQEEWELYSNEQRRDLLQTIRQGSQRMERLVNNLLAMVRVESGRLKLKREWCDLEDIVRVAVNRIEQLSRRQLRIVIPPELPLVPADFMLIEQVLANLLDNAVKYSPGEIEIRAEHREKEVAVSVSDRGPGIPEQDLELIFDKFYRVKDTRRVGGTGLGLTICKAIVEAHGGRIKAVNRAGGGVAITFTLPLDDKGPGTVPELQSDRGDRSGD